MPPHGQQLPPTTPGRYENKPSHVVTSHGTHQVESPSGSPYTPGNKRGMSAPGNPVGSNPYTPGGNNFASSGTGQSASTATSAGMSRAPGEMPTQGNPNFPQPYDNAKRTQAYNRQSEELHIPSNYGAMGQQQSSSYNTSQDSGRAGLPPHTSSNLPLPGALQSGSSGRPSLASVNTAPSTVPVLPPISTQSHHYSSPSRGSVSSHSHSYSRSSPAGGGYINTPEASGFSSPPSHKYTSSQNPHTQSYSPLGLADIRPRADSGVSDGQAGLNPNEGLSDIPTNCNYLAPWAVYAFDWCKWPVQHQGLGDAAGKMAIGSYLEDGHNFVRILNG